MPQNVRKTSTKFVETSIPDISTSTLTIFRVETLDKLCHTMQWCLLKTRLWISKFVKIYE